MSVWQCLCDKVWTNAVSLHKSDDLLPHNICSAASLYLSDVLLRNSICATVSKHMSYVPLKYIYIYFFLCCYVAVQVQRHICVVLLIHCVTCTETRTYRYIYMCRTCSIVLYMYSFSVLAQELLAPYHSHQTCACILCRTQFNVRIYYVSANAGIVCLIQLPKHVRMHIMSQVILCAQSCVAGNAGITCNETWGAGVDIHTVDILSSLFQLRTHFFGSICTK